MLAVISLIVMLNVGVGLGELLPLIENVVCPADSANVTACIIEAVQTIKEPLITGDYGDGVKGIVLDPYVINKLEVNRGPSFKASLKNVLITGVRNFQIEKLRTDLRKKKFLVAVTFPDLVVRGQYKLEMNIVLLKLTGNGPFNLTDDPLLKVNLEFYTDKKNVVFTRPVHVDLEFVHPQLYLGNLFNGDPKLEAIDNQAINDNPNILLNELKPELERHFEESFYQIASTITKGASADELFPGY
ncbi:uncharacterized protein LOC120413840 [Culex pipiens pallens]|uniref:uncharacterized protein LOC120413840 n=1 Tax=Culex pipiens pallens TaxID=42434 RepID=UPI001954ECE5|nr:uncharacterized protein LOC120413840 [Culex pipiens pallens]